MLVSFRNRWLKFGFYGVTTLLLVGIIGGITYMIRAGGGYTCRLMAKRQTLLPQMWMERQFPLTIWTAKFDWLRSFIRTVQGHVHWLHFASNRFRTNSRKKVFSEAKLQSYRSHWIRNTTTLPVLKEWADRYHPDFQGWYFVRPNPDGSSTNPEGLGSTETSCAGHASIFHTR